MMKGSALLILAGCGRIAFDPLASNSDSGVSDSELMGLPSCFVDDFDDADIANWTTAGEWTAIAEGSGSALHNDVDMPAGATIAGLMGVTSAMVAFDLRLEAASDGDFHLQFMAPGWTDASNDSKYRVALYPDGSDNTDDTIRRVVAPQNTNLTMTPTLLTAGQWYRIAVTFGMDHAITVTIDGVPHLASGADAMLAGPFDIVFDGYRPYAIDNLDVGCTR